MTGWTGSNAQRREDRLSILRLDYEMTREDERTFQSIQAALVGTSVVLTVTLSAILTRTEGLGQGQVSGQAASLAYAPEPVLVMVPLVPFALVAFAILLGAVSTVRTYYLRALEFELQKFAGGPMAVLPVPPGGYTEFVSEMVSMRRGIRWYPYLALMILVAALVIFGGFSAYIYTGLEETAGRAAMIAFYVPLAIFLLAQAGQATVGGRGLFTDVARSYLARRYHERESTVPAAYGWMTLRRERSLGSYLLLPRLEELPKALFAPLVFLIASAALWNLTTDGLIRAFVVWFVLEYLIYEARYQWNDIRGVHEDESHRNAESRRRLPLGADFPTSAVRNVRASTVVLAIRLALAIAIPLAVGYATLAPSLALIVAVFGVAIPYEWLRAQVAAEGVSEGTREWIVRAIWVLVGGGYVVRGLAGLYLAGLVFSNGLLLIGACAFGAYGVMFVTLTWALEALTHSTRDGEGEPVPDEEVASKKPHVARLLDFLSVPPPPYRRCRACEQQEADQQWCRHPGAKERNDPIHARGLRARGAYFTPWNLALIGCAAFGGALGVSLAKGAEPGEWAALGGALGLAGGALLAHVRTSLRPAILGMTAVLLLAVGSRFGWPDALLALTPWLAFAGLYVKFRGSSYHQLTHWLQDLRSGLGMAANALLLTIAGRRTAQALGYTTGMWSESGGRD